MFCLESVNFHHQNIFAERNLILSSSVVSNPQNTASCTFCRGSRASPQSSRPNLFLPPPILLPLAHSLTLALALVRVALVVPPYRRLISLALAQPIRKDSEERRFSLYCVVTCFLSLQLLGLLELGKGEGKARRDEEDKALGRR